MASRFASGACSANWSSRPPGGAQAADAAKPDRRPSLWGAAPPTPPRGAGMPDLVCNPARYDHMNWSMELAGAVEEAFHDRPGPAGDLAVPVPELGTGGAERAGEGAEAVGGDGEGVAGGTADEEPTVPRPFAELVGVAEDA